MKVCIWFVNEADNKLTDLQISEKFSFQIVQEKFTVYRKYIGRNFHTYILCQFLFKNPNLLFKMTAHTNQQMF